MLTKTYKNIVLQFFYNQSCKSEHNDKIRAQTKLYLKFLVNLSKDSQQLHRGEFFKKKKNYKGERLR